jgi:hypothetical protein
VDAIKRYELQVALQLSAPDEKEARRLLEDWFRRRAGQPIEILKVREVRAGGR